MRPDSACGFLIWIGLSSSQPSCADLRGQHLPLEAVPAAATAYGQKYVIRATLVGPSGASAEVVTIWVVRANEDFARFVTAYPQGGA
jgi:hypothetical protein